MLSTPGLATAPSQARAAEPSRPLVVGHRGLMHSAPECTLPGFRACLALRIGFEFDVRRCKDGTLVCLHDATLDRTTDGRGNLAEVTFDQLRRLDAGSRFDTAFRGQRVPRIDEIFTLIAEEARGDLLCAVDLKETGDGLEEKVVRLAESRNVLSQLLFSGATIESADVRSRLKEASDQARTARLAAAPEDIGLVLADTDADWVYVRFLPSRDQVTRIHAAGKRVFIAGPLVAGAESANWSKAAAVGIDAVLTDFPLELATQLRQQRR
ncbi:MAG TPA: glycerophosphodiester phosphodiesterase family protein [Pirellulaceae bacterium]|nr:glycerophosphodiester phosphodiesterase family protein [Pirellulaceae bacterium]